MAAFTARMADCSSCRPQYTCQLVVEPIGAVPTPTREIFSPLFPSVTLSTFFTWGRRANERVDQLFLLFHVDPQSLQLWKSSVEKHSPISPQIGHRVMAPPPAA